MRRSLLLLAFLVCLVCACSKRDPHPAAASSASATGSAAPLPPSAMAYMVTVNEKGFTPSSIEVKKGVPAMLTFRRTSDATCAKQVVFPELHVTRDLPLNAPVAIMVPTDKARTLTFQCGMGMYKSQIVVR